MAAKFSGIPVERIRFLLFVLTGLLAGLAATLLTARIGSTRPNIALGWELEIITMVILGGVSIAGARGLGPGEPLRSMIALRRRALDENRMPNLATRRVDATGVAAVEAWISGLTGCP